MNSTNNEINVTLRNQFQKNVYPTTKEFLKDNSLQTLETN